MRLFAASAAFVLSVTMLGLGSTVAHAAPTTNVTEKPVLVTVEPGDSLSKIAKEKSTTAQRLYDANTDIENPDLIYPGDDIRIPHKDEKLTTRPFPAHVVTPSEPAAAPTTPAATAPSTSRAPAQSLAPAVAGGSVWDRLAQCESGGNWSINTGNGYYGGLQFSLSSWQAVGGSGLPSDASREEQIMRAQQLQARQGWGAWPACTAKLGIS